MGGPIFGRGVLENTPTPLIEQPLKFITHGHIFERLRYYCYVGGVVPMHVKLACCCLEQLQLGNHALVVWLMAESSFVSYDIISLGSGLGPRHTCPSKHRSGTLS